MTEDRVDWHLANWARWMRDGHVGTGYSSRASGGIGQSSNSDFESMCKNADNRCAFAVQAVIDGLSDAKRCALHHEYLHAVYLLKWPLDVALREARYLVGRDLDRRGIM